MAVSRVVQERNGIHTYMWKIAMNLDGLNSLWSIEGGLQSSEGNVLDVTKHSFVTVTVAIACFGLSEVLMTRDFHCGKSASVRGLPKSSQSTRA